MIAFLRRFKRDRDGVSAVEFAIIAPFMILLYLGAAEASLALSIDRKVTSAASALADLVAQDDVVTDQEMNDIMSAGAAILGPFRAAPLEMRITAAFMEGDGDIVVRWSDADGMAPYAEGSSISVPTGILDPNRSVIVVEVEYKYETVFSQLGVSSFDIAEVFYLRPRATLLVGRD